MTNLRPGIDMSAAQFGSEVLLDGRIRAPRGPTLDEAMAALEVPGVSISAIVEGRVAWTGGWGLVRTDSTQAVDEATMFQAGSISKMVAAVVTLRLVDAGVFGLDDAVADVAGEDLLFVADQSWRPRVTIRQLLSHTGGINTGAFPGYLVGGEMPLGREIILGSTRTNSAPVRVIALPGTAFSYSGGGYLVLQEAIRARLGVPFADVAAEYLIKPLGLTRTTYRQAPPDGNHAHGHYGNGQPIAGGHRRYPEMAAAGLWTTSHDLATVLVALLDAYAGKPAALLAQTTAEELLRQQHPSAPYGLGVVLEQRAEDLWFGHGGDTQGFLNDAVISTGGDGLVVMTNTDWSKGLIAAARARAAALYRWPASPVPDDHVAPQEVAAAIPRGRFGTADGLVEITLRAGEANRLHLEVTGQTESITLTRVGAQHWRADTLNTLLTWDESDRITITQTMQHGPVSPLVANRVAP